jgi:hypothetical protein
MTYNVAKLLAVVVIFIGTIVALAVDAVGETAGVAILTGLVAYVVGNANVTGISSIVEKNQE